MTYLMIRPSPVGMLHLASDGESLTGLWLEGQKYFAASLDRETLERPNLPVFQRTAEWLDTYFARSSLPHCRLWHPRAVLSSRRCGRCCWTFHTEKPPPTARWPRR